MKAIEVGIETGGGPAMVSARFVLEVMESLGWNATEHRHYERKHL